MRHRIGYLDSVDSLDFAELMASYRWGLRCPRCSGQLEHVERVSLVFGRRHVRECRDCGLRPSED